MNTANDEAVNEKEAARILGISPLTLRKMRCIGPREDGLPAIPFLKYSSKCVRYSLADLEEYKRAHRVEPEGGAA